MPVQAHAHDDQKPQRCQRWTCHIKGMRCAVISMLTTDQHHGVQKILAPRQLGVFMANPMPLRGVPAQSQEHACRPDPQRIDMPAAAALAMQGCLSRSPLV